MLDARKAITSATVNKPVRRDEVPAVRGSRQE